MQFASRLRGLHPLFSAVPRLGVPSAARLPKRLAPHGRRGDSLSRSVAVPCRQLHSSTPRSFSQTRPAMSPSPESRLVCPTLNLDAAQTPPGAFEDEVAFFSSIPWTAAILSAPGAVAFLPPCRNTITDKNDQLFGRTLANDRSVQHMLCVFSAPSLDDAADPERSVLESETLIAVGDGVSGHSNIVHGGFVASMMDEAMGAIFDLNITLKKSARAFQTSNVTGGLDVTYLKPTPTNSVVCITAKVVAQDGRKTKIDCEVKNESGEVLAKCSSRWVAVRSNL